MDNTTKIMLVRTKIEIQENTNGAQDGRNTNNMHMHGFSMRVLE